MACDIIRDSRGTLASEFPPAIERSARWHCSVALNSSGIAIGATWRRIWPRRAHRSDVFARTCRSRVQAEAR